jgi:hypothetical protein
MRAINYLAWAGMSCPHPRNARGIDIIAYSTDGQRFVKFQVKALSKRNSVPIPARIGAYKMTEIGADSRAYPSLENQFYLAALATRSTLSLWLMA